MIFFKESKCEKKMFIFFPGGGKGEGVGVARVSDFFSKESKSEKKFLREVKGRENWLV